MRVRAFDGLPSSVNVDDNSFEIVIATETPVRVFIDDPRVPGAKGTDNKIEVDEVLLASGLDLSRAARMPLLDNHDVFGGISKVIGKIEDVRVDANRVLGRGILSHTHMRERPEFLRDLAEGFHGQVSAGFVVNAYDLVEREGDVPLAIATSWTLQEGSLVPVGADPNASVRSGRERTFPAPKVTVKPLNTRNSKRTEKRTMADIAEIEALVEDAEEILAEIEEAIEAAGDEVSDELAERAAKLRGKREPEDEKEERRRKRRKARKARQEADDKKDPDDAGERGKRADKDPDDEEELTEEEEKEVRSLRTAAKSYGLEGFVDDLVFFGAKPAEIKSAIRSAALKQGAAADAATRTRADVQLKPRGKRTAAVIDTDAIYDRWNGRSAAKAD